MSKALAKSSLVTQAVPLMGESNNFINNEQPIRTNFMIP
jgi:hypothetical protein